jgi:hypothetical protein
VKSYSNSFTVFFSLISQRLVSGVELGKVRSVTGVNTLSEGP